MQCHQCGRPAIQMYEVKGGRLPLCLDCSLKFQQIVEMQLARFEREMNYLDDLASDIAGLPRSGPKYPERKPPVQVQGMTLNNINVHGGSIGVLNTGSIQKVDVAIGAIKQSGDADLGAALTR